MKTLLGLASAALLALTFTSTASAIVPAYRGGFEVFQGRPNAAGQSWYFRLRANNSAVVLQSEAYAAKAGAIGGVNSVKATGVSNAVVQRAANGQFYFNVRGLNFQITATSETYKSKSNVKRALDAVQAVINWVKAYKIPTRGL